MRQFMSNLVIWQAGLFLLMCLSIIGLRIELMPFKGFAGIFGLAIMASIALAVIVLFKFVAGSQSSLQYSALSLVFAIAVVGGMANFVKQVVSAPRIHDISTNLVDVPQFSNAQALRKSQDNSLAFSEKVAREQQAAYPQLKTLSVAMSLSDAFKKSIVIAKQLGWQVHFADEPNGIIEATHTSALFGFIDDIVIRVQELDDEGKSMSQIDLRSASRVGESDLGANAKRIKAFTKLLRK
jgi:uncharacterized protein (DUF1499 family)